MRKEYRRVEDKLKAGVPLEEARGLCRKTLEHRGRNVHHTLKRHAPAEEYRPGLGAQVLFISCMSPRVPRGQKTIMPALGVSPRGICPYKHRSESRFVFISLGCTLRSHGSAN